MKRVITAVALAFLTWVLQAKSAIDTFPPKVNKTQIEIVYNQYFQDGNKSAITGGEGTEKLIVYGPSMALVKTKNRSSKSFQLGVDVITSASTDNIDYVVSSSSRQDQRTYVNAGMDYQFPSKNITIGGQAGVSMESDYFSYHGLISMRRKIVAKQRNYGATLQYYNDDLRWGRITKGTYKATKLIYPVELRGKDWFDIYKRYTWNLNTSVDQVVNGRNIVGLYMDFTLQKGLLSTPFHRVYFDDTSVRVENLPTERLKLATSMKWNRAIGTRFVSKQHGGMYVDNFGIRSGFYKYELAFKYDLQRTFLLDGRLYAQTTSPYFASLGKHDISAEFYTSDYDLSSLQSLKIGMGMKYYPYSKVGSLFFDEVIFRYAYYMQTTGRKAHILTASFQFRKDKN